MGVDLHALKLLQYVTSKEPLGDVATLGRQCVHLDATEQRKLLSPPPDKAYGPYCEDLLLERFGARSVTSIDASDYEHATIVHDMNTPIQATRQFDTVIDFGTLEHVFNVSVAFSNVAAMCKKGGRIIHVLPANNFSGHGFYQFSPELFFSVYSQGNGFTDTEVFIAEVTDRSKWWKSSVPQNGVRVEFTSAQRSLVLAVSRKAEIDTRQSVQQSDYVVNWADGEVKKMAGKPSLRESTYRLLKGTPGLWRLAEAIAKPVNTFENARYHRLSDSNGGYRHVVIDDMIARQKII